MEHNNAFFKEDINFLEYPTWVIDRRNKATTWSIEKPNGKYKVRCQFGLPKHLDKVILYYLLHKLHQDKRIEECTLVTNRYSIVKNVFPGVKDAGQNKFMRVMQAIEKWTALLINFEGVFYESDGYTTRSFHIIDEYILRDSGNLEIRFNNSYIKQLNETKYFMLINFDQYRKLHKTSSARLYEILSKTYKGRDEWAIGIQTLAEKLTFEKRENAKSYYPSDVLRYIRPGINEINKKTDLSIAFSFNKETGVCVFKKIQKPKDSFIPATKAVSKRKDRTKQDMNECLAYFNSLSESQKEKIIDDISRQPFLQYLSSKDLRILAYLKSTNQWRPSN